MSLLRKTLAEERHEAPAGDGWIDWHGGECPVPRGVVTWIRRRCDGPALYWSDDATCWRWTHNGNPTDIVAYRVEKTVEPEKTAPEPNTFTVHRDTLDHHKPRALDGGKLKGDHYYRVQVAEPISPELTPYAAECADIIEALGMTFNEGEAFKALWRLAAARQGRGKPGTSAQYDADKAAHYGARVAAQIKREGKPREAR